MALREPINRIKQILSPSPSPDDDLTLIDQDVVYTDDGVLDHVWLHLTEGGQTYHKAVCLNTLTYLPREEREVMTVIEKTRKLLRGIYTAQVDLVYIAANITDPPLGVVQVYGVQAAASEREEALAAARQGLGTLRAAMANFEQSRMAPVTVTVGEWINRACYTFPLPVVLIGHPDPRDEGAKGLSTDDPTRSGEGTTIGLQQNEYVFRGMVAEGHPFLNVVIGSRLGHGDQQRDLFRMQERVAQALSLWASKERFSRGISVGLSLPVMLTGGLSDGASSGYGVSESQSEAQTAGQSVSAAHTEGRAESDGWGVAHSEAETWGESHTTGENWANTVTQQRSQGHADGSFASRSESHGEAESSGSSQSQSSSWSTSVANSEGASMHQDVNASLGALGTGVGASGGIGRQASQTISRSSSGSSSHSSFRSHTESHSVGQSHGASHSESHAQSRGVSRMRGGFRSHTVSRGGSRSTTRSTTHSETTSEADTLGVGLSRAHSKASGIGLSRAQSLTRLQSLGLAAGVSPSVAVRKTYQGEDHVATMVADALREQMALLKTMAKEGGLYVDNYFLLPTPQARQALEALTAQAFHGTEDVVTPVRPRRLTPKGDERIRACAMSFTPSARPSASPWALEPWAHTTMLTLLQAAAYVAPGAFEHGTAVTVQERVPPFAFHADMPGEVVLGHQFSTETTTCQPTDAPVRLSRKRMSNWLFAADTRFGKSVAAERLALELVARWDYRVVVADFGAGWRKLARALPADRVDVWGLSPGSPHPLRWNPLQIGPRIAPMVQMTATVELLCNAGRMGERQLGHITETLEQLYVEHGVLVYDPAVQTDATWGTVQDQEGDTLGLAAGRSLQELDEASLQALAVHRSRTIDLRVLVERLEQRKQKAKSFTDKSAIEGAVLRLKHLTRGRMGVMYGAGSGTVAIETLARGGGLAILEGGSGLNEYAKAALLSLMTWHIYTDAVKRRAEIVAGADYRPMCLLLEEGNKIVTGVDAQQDEGPRMQSDIFPRIFRDAGKYHVYLGIIVQTPAKLPTGIVSSCNNAAIGQLKDADDVQAMMSAIARSPVGFMDTDYGRFIRRMPQAQFILKLGLSQDARQIEPLLYRPLMVDVAEPTDGEIREMYRGRGFTVKRRTAKDRKRD